MLEGEKATKYYGGLAAVLDVTFHVDEGEIVGLIGPNGAGKTTLFNLISGAVPLTSGKITFRGRDCTKMRPHNICRLGLVRTFQAGQLFPKMTVFENVYLGALFGAKHESPAAARDNASRLLKLVGVCGRDDVLAKDLTLAQQKRLEIARALATQPELIVLDEVMAGLTPTEVAQAVQLIRSLRDDHGVTIFLIEHIMKAVMGLSDRIIVLHHGEKIAEGTPQEVASDESVIRVYLGE
jgi:branched-chain amino acid transport system ATP-binding protein